MKQTRELRRWALGAALLAGLAVALPERAHAGSSAVKARASAPLSAAAQSMLQWVLQSGDNEGAPFAVIDKRRAHLWPFAAEGRPKGNTPVLLGLARGDDSVPGIGDRPLSEIQPHERTTPAGRFVVERGRNLKGEDIFWIDYDAAVSMHRVRATNIVERRLQRLATPTAEDNRISYGCINVPAAFYDQAVDPLFSASRPVVYLLPETVPSERFFPSKPTAVPRP